MSTVRITLELPADVVIAARRAALHSRQTLPGAVTEALRRLATARPVREACDLADAQTQLGLGRSGVWQLVRAGELPQPEVGLSGRSVWQRAK